jgi:hypothetical protein|tara:strand:- start:3568 stop:4470 length:903 start_codon:yes stop_codon:yes gene_type:complete
MYPEISGVTRKSQVFKYVKSDQFRIEVKERAPGGTTPIREVRGNQEPINPVNFAVGSLVTDEEREEANVPGNFNWDPEEDAVEDIADQLWMKREQKMSEVLYSELWSGNAAGGISAGGTWGDSTEANDTFVQAIQNGKKTIVSNTGKMPNSLFLDMCAWTKISQSPKWTSRLTTTQQLVTPEIVGRELGLDVRVGWAINNIDDEAVDPDAFTSEYLMSPPGANNDKGHGFLFYKPANPGRKRLTAGYQYSVIKQKSRSIFLMTMRRAADRRSDVFEGEREFDFATMCLDCGILWKETAAV